MSPIEPEKTQADLELEQRNLLGQIFRTRMPQTHAPESREGEARPKQGEPVPDPPAPMAGPAPSIPAISIPETTSTPAPLTPAPATTSAPLAPARTRHTPRAPSERPGVGILSLCALAVVAVAIVGAVFGIGLMLLTQHPISEADRNIASPPAARGLPVTPRPPAPPVLKVAAAGASPPTTTQGSAATSGAAQRAPSNAPTVIAGAPVPASVASPNRLEAHSPTSAAAHDAPLPKTMMEAPPAKSLVDTPPAPARTVTQPLSSEGVLALLARGDTLFHRGNFPAARLLYQQAFDSGSGRGALGLGATYDPSFLNRDDRHGLLGDLAIARFWYRSALALGEAEGKGRLTALDAAQPR